MYTIDKALPKLGLSMLVNDDNGGGIVLGAPNFEKQAALIGKSRKAETTKAAAKVTVLASKGLEVVKGQKFCTFPMKAVSGIFEIRVSGVRYYGGRLGHLGGREITVLLGAEDKKGAKADQSLLATCVSELKRLQTQFEPIQKESTQ